MILSVLIAAAFILQVYLAFTSITMQKPRNASHWLMFATACCAAFWTFFSFFAYNAETLADLKFWFHISTFGMFLFFPTNLLFVISIIPNRRIKPITLTILLPAFALFILNYYYPVSFSDFIQSPRGWIFIPTDSHPVNLAWILYAALCFLAGIIHMAVWRKNTSLNRERNQIKLLIISQAAAEVFTLLEYRLHDLFLGVRLASISQVIICIWIMGMVIAVKRYNFLSISPEDVSEEILGSISETIVLVDENEKISYMNKKAESLFRRPYYQIEKTELRKFLSNRKGTMTLVPELMKEKNTANPIQLDLTLVGVSQERTELKMTVQKLSDKYGDPMGYLFIGKENNSHGIWEFTKREAEIADRLTGSSTNLEIAENLKISEQTVKNHIAAIYRKAGVSNRMEFLTFFIKNKKTPPA